MSAFKICYKGGAVVHGDGFDDWKAAPDDGVLRVDVQVSNDHTQALYGREQYFATPDGVWGHSDDSIEEVRKRYPGAAVKRGKWTTAPEMKAVQGLAVEAKAVIDDAFDDDRDRVGSFGPDDE